MPVFGPQLKMFMKPFQSLFSWRIVVLVLLTSACALPLQAALIKNPSFELNYNETWPHYGSIDEWTGGSGVNDSSGPFHNNGTPIPDQNRVAFSQGSRDLSQEITGLTPGKRYLIQFFYDARGCCGGTIDVITKFNGVELDKITNLRPVTGGKPYNFRSVAFTPEVDSGTLTFTTLAGGDATALFDAVTIVQRDAGNAVVMNPSFEAGGDVPDPGLVSPNPIAGWTGDGQYGINISGTGPLANNGTAPDQDHVAFIQGPGSLSQVVPNLVIGKPYQVMLAYNATTGKSPRIQVKAGNTVLFEEDVAPVGGTAPYRTKTATFVATDITATLTIAQTKAGDHTVLIDDVRVTGDVQAPLPPLKLTPNVAEIGPAQRQTVSVMVPRELLAGKAATLSFRSPNTNVARLLNSDADGLVTLNFERNGANEKTFDIEGVNRGVARIEVVESAGLTVVDDVTVHVVTSFVRNSSFESTGVPGGVGYGSILAWEGGSGLNTSAGPFHDNGTVPDRKQIAFIQGAKTMSQQIVSLVPGRSYWLQFFYNARAAGNTTIDLTVKLDGKELVKIPAIAAVGAQNSYNFRNVGFVASSSSSLLEFVTVPSGDATVLLDGITIVQREPGEIVVRNPSFEASGNPAGVGYIQPDNIAGWEASGGGRGVNINGVGPFSDNGLSSDQDRIVFLQGAGTAISQNLAGFVPGQKYTLVYEVNTRICCNPDPSSYNVLFADEVIFQEELSPLGGTTPYTVKTVAFTPQSAEGVLKFEHTSQGDHSLLLDNIRVVKGDFIPTVPEPALGVARLAGGRIRLSWPSSAADFRLQMTTGLPGGWVNANAAVIVEGNQNVVTITPDSVTRFFRLTK